MTDEQIEYLRELMVTGHIVLWCDPSNGGYYQLNGNIIDFDNEMRVSLLGLHGKYIDLHGCGYDELLVANRVVVNWPPT